MSDPKDTPKTVTLVAPADQGGGATDVPIADEQAWRDRGFTSYTTAARASDAFDRQIADQTPITDTIGRNLVAGATGGLSELAGRLVDGEDYRIHAENSNRAHPTAATLSNIAGGLAVSGAVGKVGAGISELAGGGVLASGAGAAAEGAIYGAGQGVHELALSADPLTAEHVASTLSSNVLLGAGIGGVAGVATKGVERVLARAGDALTEATAARSAIAGIPEDLAGLDDKGLIDAAKTAKAEHAAAIDTEKVSLEQTRVGQRADVAKQIQELHENLANERQIFSPLSNGNDLNPALQGIDGIQKARVQLAESFGTMQRGLRSDISVARDPGSMIRPLEERQSALQTLQAKMPELQAALAGDERAGMLAHVDDALAETKQQIADVRSLNSRTNPVASGRLTQLTAGPSERMTAIDAAREAMKAAPELGMVGKAAKGAAFAGGTALAHMLPGVGIAAPFVGKAVSDAVGKLFERTAGTVGKVAGKAATAASKFLSAAKSLEPYTTGAATKVLSEVKFGPAGKATSDDLAGLYRARTSELYQQTERQPDGSTTMRPEARAAMAAQLDPYRQVNPILADKIESVQARKVAYLASIAPKKPDPPALQIGPDNSRPPDLAIRGWARAVRAVEDPASVEERLARGIVTPEEADAYRTVYPERFAELQREIFAGAPMLEKTLPMNKKVALSIFTGIPVTPAMQPNVLAVLQSTFDVEPGTAGGTTAPTAQPSFGAMGSLKDIDKPTPAQERMT